MRTLKIWAFIMALISVIIIVTSCVLVNDKEQTETTTETIVVTKASETIKSKIKFFEGFTDTAVEDHGAYAYGYGHRDNSIQAGNTITREEADALFEQDIVRFEEAVVHFADEHSLSFTQNEFDALTCFLYNLGEHYLEVIEERAINDESYKLVDLIVSGEYTEDELITEWTSYCHAGGEVVQGLLARRSYEVNLFLKGEY